MLQEERGKSVIAQRGGDLGGVGNPVIKLPGHHSSRANRRRRDLVGRYLADEAAVIEVPGRGALETRVEEEDGPEHEAAQDEPDRPARSRFRRGGGRGRPLVQLIYPVRWTRPGRRRVMYGTEPLASSPGKFGKNWIHASLGSKKFAKVTAEVRGSQQTSSRACV